MSKPFRRPVWTAYQVITCIMPAGRGAEVLDSLRIQQGVISASAHHARGIGTQTLRHRVHSEAKQIITAMVEVNQADAVFEFIYFAANLDQPHAGMVFMSKPLRGIGVVPFPDEVDANVLDVPF